jgi:hypothetical protein
LRTIAAFLRAHDLAGFRVADSYHSTRGHYVTRTLTWPAGRHRLVTRVVDETIAALPGRTVIRVEAKVAWVYPRSPREVVPAATSKIVVHAPKFSRTVTDPAKVARIVRWFDALPVSPPGLVLACVGLSLADITLSFRSASGRRLAYARVPAPAAGPCYPIGFRIGGRARKHLIDQPYAESFARRVERLLGFRIATPKG